MDNRGKRSRGRGGRPPSRATAPVPPAPVMPAGHPTGEGVRPPAMEADEEGRFPVDLPGFRGPLEQLVGAARRGDVDLGAVSVSEITAGFRQRLAGIAEPDAQEIADFLDQASRLVALKAAQVVPDTGVDLQAEDGAGDPPPVDDAGSRVAEYRLFRAAVDGFLAGATDQASQSFLAAISPEVVPTEKLSISQERLAGALRGALARLPETATVPVSVPPTSVSVDDRAAAVRALLAERGTVPLEQVFATAATQLEAVATFLALLELLKRGEIRVEPDATGAVVVTATSGADADADPGGAPAPGGVEVPAELPAGGGQQS
ncbi:MAG: chromosome segregation protein ScpA [Chloroflexi bacterium]|jgi:segregation and condensation protein A|nr:chromosome segregation protein ScpA [Chloroflexota bacterium]